MIVMSVKWTLKKVAVAVAAVIGAVIVAGVLINALSGDTEKQVQNAEEGAAFLEKLGWEVDLDGVKERTVVIPAEFDEVFESYNALQKKAGFDLEDYKGKEVKKYTYIILNYPSAENGDIIKADLLVLDGKVVGGDLYSPRLDGFITGLEKRGKIKDDAA